jgi:hypothetical protein
MEAIGRQGPGHLAEWKAATNCRITKEGLKRAVENKIIGNINCVKTRRAGLKSLGNFDTFPADAQLCVASLTWANGNEFSYPNFCKACREANWFEAAKECGFSDKSNTLPKRQAAQELMMHNAGCTALGVASPDVLHWPARLAGGAPPAQATPTWLGGWWKVTADGEVYYYYFGSAGIVAWTDDKPANSSAPMVHPQNRGTFSLSGSSELDITWNFIAGGQTKEHFKTVGSTRQMSGTSNRYGPLTAVKA